MEVNMILLAMRVYGCYVIGLHSEDVSVCKIFLCSTIDGINEALDYIQEVVEFDREEAVDAIQKEGIDFLGSNQENISFSGGLAALFFMATKIFTDFFNNKN